MISVAVYVEVGMCMENQYDIEIWSDWTMYCHCCWSLEEEKLLPHFLCYVELYFYALNFEHHIMPIFANNWKFSVLWQANVYNQFINLMVLHEVILKPVSFSCGAGDAHSFRAPDLTFPSWVRFVLPLLCSQSRFIYGLPIVIVILVLFGLFIHKYPCSSEEPSCPGTPFIEQNYIGMRLTKRYTILSNGNSLRVYSFGCKKSACCSKCWPT